MVHRKSIVSALAALLIGGVSTAQQHDLWPIYEDACNSNGIDRKRCLCILDDVVTVHGEDAARYVGLDMVLRYDEAAALLEKIGEEKAFAASDQFDVAQNKSCSSGRLARLEGTYVTAAPAAAVSSSAAVAANAEDPRGLFETVSVVTRRGVIDLTALTGPVVGDVTVLFGVGVSPTGGATNIRNYLGFYRIVDEEGGIDLNGDGTADRRPGDDDYAAQVQARALSTKLYISESAGREQVIGEVHLDGGALYAPFFRYQIAGAGAGLGANPPTSAADIENLTAMLRKRMSTPSHLFFVFDAANTDGARNMSSLGDDRLGFSATPRGDAATFDDAVFSFAFGQ